MQLRTFSLIISTAVISASALAADDSFVGRWKFNPDKSQLTGLDYKIEDAGGGQYKFAFGDDVETLTLDGKPHLTKYGNTWSIKTTGPNSWDSTIKRNGKVIVKSKWNISEDGQTFTSDEENMRPDGSTGNNVLTLKRTAGTSGLVGSWESSSMKIMSPTSIEIVKGKGGGYSLSNPVYKEHLEFKLDGKKSTPTGPRVAKGTSVTSKKVDDQNIELTYELKGKTTETDKWEASADGKTLTNTVTYAGVSKPEVDVYDRE